MTDIAPAPAPAIQDREAEARANGFTWAQVNDHLNQSEAAALAFGYHPDDIHDFKGNAPTSTVVDAAASHRMQTFVGNPHPDPDKAMRETYATGLVTGATSNPSQFAGAWDGGFDQAADIARRLKQATPEPPTGTADKVAGFPTSQQLTDIALQHTHEAGVEATPTNINTVKQNYADAWTDTGVHPATLQAMAQHDPELHDALTRPPQQPVDDTTLGIFQALEGSRQDQVSPAGAMSVYQIIPSTARQYGFDPERIHESQEYAKVAATAILTDLSKRYGGNLPAMAVAYNAGPGVADKWINSGRNPDVLPAETQAYLAHLSRIVPDLGDLSKPGRDRVASIGDPEMGWNSIKDLPSEMLQTLNAEAEKHKGETLEERVTNPEEEEKALGVALGFGPQSIGSVAAQGLTDLFRTPSQQMDSIFAQIGKEHAIQEVTQGTGLVRQRVQIAGTMLEQFRKDINADLPDYTRWVKEIQAGVANPRPNNIADLISYIEGVPGATVTGPYAQMATLLKGMYAHLRNEIEQTTGHTSFIQDYYTHLWDNPRHVVNLFGARTGSGASLNTRTIPTMIAGIRQGLTPKIADPLDNTMRYISTMSTYLAAHEMRAAGEAFGQVVTRTANVSPPAGWVQLRGSLNQYAAPGWAKIYNRWADPGIYGWAAPAAKIYEKLAVVGNIMTAMKIGLSGFHFMNIVMENWNSGLANALGRVSRGDLWGALKAMGLSGTIWPQITRGADLQKAYLNSPNASALDRQLMDLFARSGGRAFGRGEEFNVGTSSNYWQAFRRGSFWPELENRAAKVAGNAASETAAARIAYAPGRAAEFFAKEIGNIMSTAMSPLFDKMIPRVKLASWAAEMEDWLKANPTSTQEAVLAKGRQLQRAMDDRFGEMVQDNLFWPRAMKQALNLLTVSIGWEYGSLRVFGSGAKDILNGDFLSPRSRWLIAFPIVTALANSAYQYLKTGKGPQRWQDLVTPQTGGTNPRGAPEATLLPGYQKEPLSIAAQLMEKDNPIAAGWGYAQGKMAPLSETVLGIATGENWAAKNITGAYATSQTPDRWSSYMNYLWQQTKPIILENELQKGSALSFPERFMGLRPAPQFMEDYEGYKAMMDRVNQNALQDGMRFQQQQNQRMANPDPNVPLAPQRWHTRHMH